MKRGLLSAFRALVLAICIMLLARIGGYEIKSGQSVALFILGIAAAWILVEKLLFTMLTSKKPKPRGH